MEGYDMPKQQHYNSAHFSVYVRPWDLTVNWRHKWG